MMTSPRNHRDTAMPTVVLVLLLLFGIAVNVFAFLDGQLEWGLLAPGDAETSRLPAPEETLG